MEKTKKDLKESIKALEGLLERLKEGGLKNMRAVRTTEMTLKALKSRLTKEK